MRARLAAWAALPLLAACATPRPGPAALPVPPAAITAPAAVAVAATVAGDLATLSGWSALPLDAARKAFLRGCPALARRVDRSGLTDARDWAAACADTGGNARTFFEKHFTAVRLGDGRGLATGYFEPEIAGCLSPSATCATPLYKRPDDLVEVDLGAFAPDLKGRTIRGRWTGRTLAPYSDRAAIEDGALAGRGLELAWAVDPVELFFLEIQGSGRLRLADGGVSRVGYAGQNGRAYVPIGRLLRERGALPAGGAGMAAIVGWIRANPVAGRALMRENPSTVFFRALDPALDGPIGALGVPLIAEATAAADPATLPLGAPVWVTTRIAQPGSPAAPWSRLVIAQDTGGAIRGANRLDIFWGAGERARAIAGDLSAAADALLLLPRAAAQRLTGRLADAAQPRR